MGSHRGLSRQSGMAQEVQYESQRHGQLGLVSADVLQQQLHQRTLKQTALQSLQEQLPETWTERGQRGTDRAKLGICKSAISDRIHCDYIHDDGDYSF